MPDETVRAAIPVPLLTDPPNIETSIHPLADRVDVLLGAEVLTELERDGLDAADRFEGRTIFNSDSGQVEVWSGSAWVSAIPEGTVTPEGVTQVVQAGAVGVSSAFARADHVHPSEEFADPSAVAAAVQAAEDAAAAAEDAAIVFAIALGG